MYKMEFNRKIIDYLNEWYQRKGRQPLILRGARQVGKTQAVSIFCRKNNIDLIHLNLEKAELKKPFRDEISLAEFERIINNLFQKSIYSPNTLLFIDEIQEVPFLLKLLRFFYEDKPEVPVIAAGSLLEARLKYEKISMPVGRVEFAYVYPLDFFEYLEAVGETGALKIIKEFDFGKNLSLGLHESLISHFQEYALVGGMPKAVQIYGEYKSLPEVNKAYSELFTSFKNDIHKYVSIAQAKYVNFILENAPDHAGKLITYEKFGESQFRHREIGESFEALEEAMLIYLVRGTKSIDLPILTTQKKSPKLIFLDTGLVNFLMGIQDKYVNLKDLNNLFRGRIAEQIVGQELLSSGMIIPSKVHYWHVDKVGGAELDFCVVHQGKIIGFEVKSGAAGKMKSANIFMQKIGRTSQVIRVYSGEFRREKNFISLPFYLLPRWKEII